MIIYNAQKQNTALSTTADFMTIVSGATRSTLVLEIDAEGDGTASAYNEFGLYRATGAGVTGSGAITPVLVDSPNTAPTYTGSVFGGWTTQPTLGALIHQVPINANGQRYFWRANPNMSNAIVIPGGGAATGTLSVRGINGTSNISLRLQFAEF